MAEDFYEQAYVYAVSSKAGIQTPTAEERQFILELRKRRLGVSAACREMRKWLAVPEQRGGAE